MDVHTRSVEKSSVFESFSHNFICMDGQIRVIHKCNVLTHIFSNTCVKAKISVFKKMNIQIQLVCMVRA